MAVGVMLGEGIGAALEWQAARRAREQDRAIIKMLMMQLVMMGDTLQEVSIENLQRRGGWDRALFDDVLARVELLRNGSPFRELKLDATSTHAQTRWTLSETERGVHARAQ